MRADRDIRWWGAFLASAAVFGAVGPACADRIENGVAVFSALDKVTARTSTFPVALGQTSGFGTLKITPRACYSRSPTEAPRTTTFVEIDETQLDGTQKRVFTGWMFAESPGLYGLEHPTIDVWLTECQKPVRTTAEKPSAPGEASTATAARRPVVRDDAAAPAQGGQSAGGGAGATSEELPPIDGTAVETDQEFRRRIRR